MGQFARFREIALGNDSLMPSFEGGNTRAASQVGLGGAAVEVPAGTVLA